MPAAEYIVLVEHSFNTLWVLVLGKCITGINTAQDITDILFFTIPVLETLAEICEASFNKSLYSNAENISHNDSFFMSYLF